MEIRRFIDGAVAGDRGTINCRVELMDGSVIDLGLDCRIPKKKSERRIFSGGGYPTDTKARTLELGGEEEAKVIGAITSYLERTCGFLRRESLDEADPQSLCERDMADRMALLLLKAILDRTDPPPRKAWLP